MRTACIIGQHSKILLHQNRNEKQKRRRLILTTVGDSMSGCVGILQPLALIPSSPVMVYSLNSFSFSQLSDEVKFSRMVAEW